MRLRSVIAAAVGMVAATTLSSCSLSLNDLGGSFRGHVWEMFATGNVAGADIAHDLGFGSVSAQPELEGAFHIWRNRFDVDWAHLDRNESGQVASTFTFVGQPIPVASHVDTSVKADVVKGTYGFVIGPELLSVTPQLGIAYVNADTKINGMAAPAALSPVPAPGVPVSGEEKGDQPFPIGGLTISSLPLDWLEVEGRAAGFGIPEGYVVDAQAMMGVRYYHARADFGYRYVRFDFGDTHIRLKGFMFGAGVYF